MFSYLSSELLLIILILVYMVLAIVLGLIRGWKYLKSYPDEKLGKEYHRHNERIVLTLAGFSLTALSLFISIQFRELAQISSTLLFFSIAFSALISSSIFIRFRIRKFFLYLSDVLLNVGLLAIGCGFLVFFGDRFSYYDSLTIVFVILVVVLFLVSLVNYFFFDKYVKYWQEVIKMSNEESDQKENRIIIRHLTMTRCPKCGQLYLPENGHKCRKSNAGQMIKEK